MWNDGNNSWNNVFVPVDFITFNLSQNGKTCYRFSILDSERMGESNLGCFFTLLCPPPLILSRVKSSSKSTKILKSKYSTITHPLKRGATTKNNLYNYNYLEFIFNVYNPQRKIDSFNFRWSRQIVDDIQCTNR